MVLAGKVVGIFLGMVNNVILARLFGPANFGVYTLFIKTCNVAGMVSQLGSNAATVKYVGIMAGVEEWGKLKGFLHSIFWIVATGSVITVTIIWLARKPIALSIFDSPELCKVMVFCVLIVPLQNGLLLLTETFRGLQDLRWASFLPVLQQAVFLLLLVLLYFACFACMENVLLALATGLFCSIITGIWVLQRGFLKRARPEKIRKICILKESLPMMVTRGSMLIISTMDVYVLGIYTSPAEVGIYGVVSALATLTVFSLNIINQVIPAMIAHYNARRDFETLSYVVRFASTIGAFFSVPVLICLILFGKYILEVVFGPQYAGGVIALNFLVISQLVNSISGSCGFMLQMTGFHMDLTRISVACGMVNVFLNILLVKPFGKEGVAAATAFSIIMQNVLVLVIAYQRTGIWTLPSVEIGKEIVKQVRGYIWNLFSR